MKPGENQNPFDPVFDPGLGKPVTIPDKTTTPHACECGINRRDMLIMASALAAAPVLASANAMVPCIQTRQQVQPCQHKFCRHYGGDKDYYDR